MKTRTLKYYFCYNALKCTKMTDEEGVLNSEKSFFIDKRFCLLFDFVFNMRTLVALAMIIIGVDCVGELTFPFFQPFSIQWRKIVENLRAIHYYFCIIILLFIIITNKNIQNIIFSLFKHH